MVKLTSLSLMICFRYTLPNRREHTALNATNTPSTRCLSTRQVRPPLSPRVREDMMPSKKVSVDRPSPSSERRQRLPRRSHSSSSAPLAREEDYAPSSVARHSFLERRKRLAVVPSIEQHAINALCVLHSQIVFLTIEQIKSFSLFFLLI